MSFPDYLQPYIETKVRPTQLPIPGTIHTYSVRPNNEQGRVVRYGSDDQTYSKFPELVQLVPRGYSQLFNDEILKRTRRVKSPV